MYLLDVNVLLALLSPTHIHHRSATSWYAVHSSFGWSLTSVTFLGAVRIMAQPTYKEFLGGVADAYKLIRTLQESQYQLVLQSNLEPLGTTGIPDIPSKHLTDWYLIKLAQYYRLTFVTFDALAASLGSNTLLLK